MDVSLTDLLTCPRCGPAHGLILLPDEVRNRRVVSGVLGCANCRERYPVENGVADLGRGAGEEGVRAGGGSGRVGRRNKRKTVDQEAASEEEATRLAALLGLSEGGGVVLMAGPAAVVVERVADLAPGILLVTSAAGGAEVGVASRLRLGPVLPLRSWPLSASRWWGPPPVRCPRSPATSGVSARSAIGTGCC